MSNSEVALVEVQNGQIVVSSLQIAEHFKKQHKHVLDAIRVEMGYAEKSADPSEAKMFHETTYIHPQNGQEYPMFLMNRDGFSLLAMGFTGKEASEWKRKYIKAFNQMEEQIKSLLAPSYQIADPIERAKKWIEEESQRRQLEEKNQFLIAENVELATKNEQLAEKLDYEQDFKKNIFEIDNALVTITDAIKLVNPKGFCKGYKRKDVFALLRQKGMLTKNNLATAKAIKDELMETKQFQIPNPKKNGAVMIKYQSYLTQKGLDWLNKQLS